MYIYIYISVLGFVKRRSRRGWSTRTPNTFMTDKADARKAGATTGEDLNRAWWHTNVVPPLELFILRVAQEAFSKEETTLLKLWYLRHVSLLRWTIGDGQCDKKGIFQATFESLCNDRQRRDHHSVLSWMGNDSLSLKRDLCFS